MLPRPFISYIKDKLKLLRKYQGLPKYRYLSPNKEDVKVRVYSTEDVGYIQSVHYSPELASYIYWVSVDGVVTPIPESYLSQD